MAILYTFSVHCVSALITLRVVIARHITAVLSATLLLRLNFVAVDRTCAAHEATPASSAHHTGEHHEQAFVASANADSHADTRDACDLPTRADCCLALASCSVTIGSAEADDTVIDPASAALLTLGVDYPSSRRDAPDPPPPKS
ncbi:MAG: hypothetical protein ACT4P6_22000 [Gemmatimonadaceae bacterium]